MSKTLWQHVDALTAKAFARYGFTYGDILVRWPEIAGERLAAVSQPERIRWPRAAKAKADEGEMAALPARRQQNQGGTLVLKVAAGHALLVQHEIPTLIERINTFYGYQAVTRVKIVADAGFTAGPSTGRRPPEPPPVPAREAQVPAAALEQVAESLGAIEDPQLRAALERLGKGILQRRQDDATKP